MFLLVYILYGHQNINESTEHPMAKSVAPIHDKRCLSERSVRASVPNGLEMARQLLHFEIRMLSRTDLVTGGY
jgi:hypothetical protein